MANDTNDNIFYGAVLVFIGALIVVAHNYGYITRLPMYLPEIQQILAGGVAAGVCGLFLLMKWSSRK